MRRALGATAALVAGLALAGPAGAACTIKLGVYQDNVVGGNQQLAPERGDSFDAGLDFQIPSWPHATLSIDYFNIDLHGFIEDPLTISSDASTVTFPARPWSRPSNRHNNRSAAVSNMIPCETLTRRKRPSSSSVAMPAFTCGSRPVSLSTSAHMAVR